MTVVFLDRDGIINVNRDDYVKTCDEFVLIPGALEGLAKLKEAGVTAVIISNQAGVGRGLIDPAEFERINRKMFETVEQAGGEISGLYYCIHRRDEGCGCRKPEIGLLKMASAEMGFPLEGSFFIGDARSDIEAGCKAKCRTVLVVTGKASPADAASWDCKPEHIAKNLPSAVDWVLSQMRG